MNLSKAFWKISNRFERNKDILGDDLDEPFQTLYEFVNLYNFYKKKLNKPIIVEEENEYIAHFKECPNIIGSGKTKEEAIVELCANLFRYLEKQWLIQF